MLTYNSSLQRQPPTREIDRDAATKAMRTTPYAAYNQNHRDVMAALGGLAGSQFNVAADKANTDYDLAQQQAQRQLVLAGLQQMGEAQQNNNSLANARLQNMVGFSSGLLRNLFS